MGIDDIEYRSRSLHNHVRGIKRVKHSPAATVRLLRGDTGKTKGTGSVTYTPCALHTIITITPTDINAEGSHMVIMIAQAHCNLERFTYPWNGDTLYIDADFPNLHYYTV